ncbi:glycosyltransferase family 4 protein [Zunongwangia sp. SCSIO 43204]|uniref:glycosyltransferase family 4 protein n=1 Tax=Zunongwangia sp. SCSIO 43204 TaxID=2779359 RepID=UPI001CA90539|nr:glycosyltransferase family 4 protein [Zunongwangia sp. SCSIO 43204]UAB84821.1 glycosyltransferase family 4 protein [Zunongwangia sp. SCSIO 43204]
MGNQELKKKKDILFLLHLPPPVHGSSMVGQWIYDSNILKSYFGTKTYINLLASKRVLDSGALSLSKLFTTIKLFFKLFFHLLLHPVDLCYFALTTTGIAFYRDIILVFFLKLFRVKRVYHIHNKGVEKASRNRLKRSLYDYVFKGSKVIILSKYLYQDICEYVSEESLYICPNGIPKINVKVLEKSKFSKKSVKILFLSNLIESKGVYILLKAMSELNNKNLDFSGIFVGGEGDVSEIRFLKIVKELGLDSKVSYLGKMYGDDKVKVFQSADIFAFPTYYPMECFPLVLLEALQYKLPIVTTPEGGILDIVENGSNGYIVPQEDVCSLALALEKLIKNKNLRKKMGELGREKYTENYKLIKFEQNLLDVFQHILEK